MYPSNTWPIISLNPLGHPCNKCKVIPRCTASWRCRTYLGHHYDEFQIIHTHSFRLTVYCNMFSTELQIVSKSSSDIKRGCNYFEIVNDLVPTGVSCEDEPVLFLLTLVIILQLFTTNRNGLHVLVLNMTVTDIACFCKQDSYRTWGFSWRGIQLQCRPLSRSNKPIFWKGIFS